MKICLIGCGGQARTAYLPSLLRCKREHPEYLLSACCDADAEKALSFAKDAEFERAYDDYTQMLEKENPGAVILVTPYSITAEIAKKIMKIGCPVLLEKPPAADFKEAKSLCAAAQEWGSIHQVAFNRRHIPLVRALKKDLGAYKVQHIDYQMYRVNRKENSFYSTAVHGVDLVCHLMGSPFRKGNLLYGKLPEYGEGVENILLQLAFENGGTAQLSFCPVSGSVLEQMTVTSQKGTYYASFPIWSETDTGRLTFEDGKTKEEIPASDGKGLFESNGFYHQLDRFLESARFHTQAADTLETALVPMLLMDAMRERKPFVEFCE